MAKNKQITYTVNKEPITVTTDLYVMVKMDEFMNAIQDLSGNAFKVWCYMAKNKWEYKEQLSSKYCQEKCGLGKTAYDNGIKELKEKGYLVDDNARYNPEDTTNYWQFFATPRAKKEKIQEERKPAPATAFPCNDEDFDFG